MFFQKKKFLQKFKSHAEVSWQEFCNKLDLKKKEEKEIKLNYIALIIFPKITVH